MSKTRFIGDLHLGQKNIISFSGHIRGNVKTVDEHDEWIVDQWNSICTKRDTIWVLGDVCMDAKKLPFLKRMYGSKHLIIGNHDEFPLSTYAQYFDKIHGFIRYKGFWVSHCPIHPNELRGKINVHGHTHQNFLPDPNYVCVSVEMCDGKPVDLEDIKRYRDKMNIKKS